MLSFTFLLCLIATTSASWFHKATSDAEILEITNAHIKAIQVATRSMNETATRQLFTLDYNNPKININTVMLVWGSYDSIVPLYAEFFNGRNPPYSQFIDTKILMKKPERTMDLYVTLRKSSESSTGWTAFNFT
ncbi:Salivary lipocalin [Caenorhabditis elegans]|uniref:Salivary lipocalin n=1 Tax=Caenorhabditis elegans TaxID=6239 RepID=Q2XN20_CAEEL|nr:Salivary lipocalin [Caenorhabditis elegans]CCD69156.1 Salivary lipocalin [Caenorhabditis elegans]|eukprot:NP_001022554.1 Uncharacterized protein CELE_F30H5.5 [Caenorhabditis elegans]